MLTFAPELKQMSLTLGSLVFGAAAIVAAKAGVKRAAEAFVIKHSERVEADAALMVKLATVRDVAAADLGARLLADETGVEP